MYFRRFIRRLSKERNNKETFLPIPQKASRLAEGVRYMSS